jgi:hypothetical protein
MLVQLVRPLVRSQVQILANNPAAESQLVNMVAQWLGYLGVQAEVTQIGAEGDLIQMALRVGKPEQCTTAEWERILQNLMTARAEVETGTELTYATMTPTQQGKVHRLLACILRAGYDDQVGDWDTIQPKLQALGLEPALLEQVRSALRVPTPVQLLVEDLEPEVAAFALSKAIHIALIDRQISAAEDDALKTLLQALDGSYA